MRTRTLLISLSVILAGCSQHPSRMSPDEEALAKQARVIGMVNNLDGCRDAIKRNPNDADAHMCIAEDTIGHNNDEAISELRAVIRIRPEDRKAQFLLAQTSVKVGNPQEARSLYEKLAREDDIWGKAARTRLQKLQQK